MAKTIEYLPNGLTLRQDDRYFKLSQDSVLLASFAQPRKRDRVLDLGCGTGAISLLLYRSDLQIIGLELQEGALALFKQSIADNHVPIQTIQGDLRDIRSLVPHGSIDYVVCNPPYFNGQRGRSAADHNKRLARQDSSCTVEDIAAAVAYVLHTGGKAAFIFRPERLCVLLNALYQKKLVAKRLRFIHQNVTAPPSAVLVECRRDGSLEGLQILPPLFVESEEYRQIYRNDNNQTEAIKFPPKMK